MAISVRRWQLSPQFSLQIGITPLILLTSALFTAFFNAAFFRNTISIYGNSAGGLAFLASLAVLLFAATVLTLSLLCYRFLTKPTLMLLFIGGAAASYYMNSFNVVVDTTMLTNVLNTDRKEIADLVNMPMFVQLLLLGVVPAWLVSKTHITCGSFVKALRNRATLILGSVLLAIAAVAPFTATYSSFFREHKILRYYANPTTFVYSLGKAIQETLVSVENTIRAPLGMDAHLPADDYDRELIVLVVGETARADRFSLNGYGRNTNPLLSQEDVISFSQVSSCGTATAYSLPCMFSLSDREDFSLDESSASENLLDVLNHADVNVLWRDNNSDSKGVANGIEFEDFQSADKNPVCDIECRDVGMLDGLEDYIAAHPKGDITIVLHQMGNHGPAYFKRYPTAFEKFTPACHDSQLENCSAEEISNAYDNAILYTDYFLGQVIAFLKQQDDHFQTAMYYMSDHGESLGEKGLYLHGLPYLLAPEEQKHVASLLWFGRNYEVKSDLVRDKADAALSHDHYFHTVLGLMEIETGVYDSSKDILSGAHAEG